MKTVKNNSTISQDLSHNIQDQVSHVFVKWMRSAKNSGVEILKEIHTFLGAQTESAVQVIWRPIIPIESLWFSFVP